MNELTRVLTVQITDIVARTDAELNGEIAGAKNPKVLRGVEDELKKVLKCDDVKIINHQLFVNEKDGSNG